MRPLLLVFLQHIGQSNCHGVVNLLLGSFQTPCGSAQRAYVCLRECVRGPKGNNGNGSRERKSPEQKSGSRKVLPSSHSAGSPPKTMGRRCAHSSAHVCSPRRKVASVSQASRVTKGAHLDGQRGVAAVNGGPQGKERKKSGGSSIHSPRLAVRSRRRGRRAGGAPRGGA